VVRETQRGLASPELAAPVRGLNRIACRGPRGAEASTAASNDERTHMSLYRQLNFSPSTAACPADCQRHDEK
jgi:hypothetical protein